jgi:hypothetical protein
MEKIMPQEKQIIHAIAYVPNGHVYHKVLLCDPSKNTQSLSGATETWTENSLATITCEECKKCLKRIPMPIKTKSLDTDKMVLLLKLLQTSRDAVFDDQGEYAYMRGEGVEALHRAINMLEVEDEQSKS